MMPGDTKSGHAIIFLKYSGITSDHNKRGTTKRGWRDEYPALSIFKEWLVFTTGFKKEHLFYRDFEQP
jgi:hypothetical protein